MTQRSGNGRARHCLGLACTLAPMGFEVDIGHASRLGGRSNNEDHAAAWQEPGRGLVAAIADGVSQGGRGLEAAQTTVMALVDDYFSAPATWHPTVVFDRLISAQNAWLASHNARGSAQAQTTLTAIALEGQSVTVAHVGDTRAWRQRGDDLIQLTRDHCVDQPDQRSRLLRAVGLDDAVRIDFAQGDARLGDCFLLTSDGVHRTLPAKHLRAMLSRVGGTAPGGALVSAQQVCDAIVDAAVAAGSRDNASALIVFVRGLDLSRLDDEVRLQQALPAPKAMVAGQVIDGCTIEAQVADNGLHRVYRARNAKGQLVAIKALHESRAADPQERALLAQEAWLGRQLTERFAPGLRRLAHDAAGESSGFVRVQAVPDATALYLVFDWHEGRTLAQLMRAQASAHAPTPVPQIVAAAIQITAALGRLHRLGVIHRDIKPDNLHLGQDGRWRILDLGTALSGRERADLRQLRAGTPSYVNPEQWSGSQPNAASDLFALGVTLYAWLTGSMPYGEVEPYQGGRYRRDPKPPSRLRPDAPVWLSQLLLKAVALDAAQRFETAEEMLLALERGAARPVLGPGATPLLRRNPEALWQIGLGVSVLINLLLIFWLLFLPR